MLFVKLQQLATVAGDVLLGKEKIQKILLARLTEAVVIWLSDEQEFWGVLEDESSPLQPHGLQQVIVFRILLHDMKHQKIWCLPWLSIHLIPLYGFPSFMFFFLRNNQGLKNPIILISRKVLIIETWWLMGMCRINCWIIYIGEPVNMPKLYDGFLLFSFYTWTHPSELLAEMSELNLFRLDEERRCTYKDSHKSIFIVFVLPSFANVTIFFILGFHIGVYISVKPSWLVHVVYVTLVHDKIFILLLISEWWSCFIWLSWQLILDMHFTVEIARFAGYPSRHVHQIAAAIIARAIRTFSARGIDPQRY